jgi:uncharacterized protein (TIGR03437 family)
MHNVGGPDYSDTGLEDPIEVSDADAFITKISPIGSQFVYSTYLGGTWNEAALGIAVDGSGNATIGGFAETSQAGGTFPATPDAFENTNSASTTAFAARLDAEGSQLLYATLLGNTATSYVSGVALDSSGNVYLTGLAGADFPTTVGNTSGTVMLVELQFESSSLPAVAPGGVVDVFTGSTGRSTPGSIVSVYGTGLSRSTASAAAFPLPASLAGASLTISGIAAPLFYAGPNQINAQIPFEVAPGVAIGIVRNANGSSGPFAIDVVNAAPSILVDPNSDRLICFNQDGTLNGPTNPAPPGSVVTLYLTGIGLVSNQPASGSPGTGLSAAVASSTANLGQFPATIEYLGLTPGSVGLAQANILVPNVPASDYPLVITEGGVASNWTIVSVGANQ